MGGSRRVPTVRILIVRAAASMRVVRQQLLRLIETLCHQSQRDGHKAGHERRSLVHRPRPSLERISEPALCHWYASSLCVRIECAKRAHAAAGSGEKPTFDGLKLFYEDREKSGQSTIDQW